MGARGALKRGIRDLERVSQRVGPDTIKLWDSYREQALLWRALALLQLPALFFAFILAMITFFYSDKVIEAPSKPEPGYLEVSDVSDKDFVIAAVNVVNLITSYQPETAGRQFKLARRSLWEPALSVFNKEYIEKQVKFIENTNRSQLFYLSKPQLKIVREKGFVEVRVPGKRKKLIGETPRPIDEMAWYVRLTTIPRNELNPLGIVVTDLRPAIVSLVELAKQDRQEARRAKRKARREAQAAKEARKN